MELPVPNLRAVVFDVGETLIDETRLWGEWADWLGVPRRTFMGVLGALVDRGRPPQEVFEVLARKGALTPTQEKLKERFAEGLAAYRAQEWDKAKDAFDACLEIKPGDLLHGDENGLMKIPPAALGGLQQAVEKVRTREKRLMDLMRSPEFSVDKLKGKFIE